MSNCRVSICLVTVWASNRAMEEIEFALSTFNTDFIDLYRLYTSISQDRGIIETRIRALQQAKEEGKIRAIGLTAHDQKMLVEMLRTYPELDYIFFPYNFRHQRFSPVTSIHATSWGALKAERAARPLQKSAAQTPDCIFVPCPDPEFASLVEETGVGLIAIKPFGRGDLLRLDPDDPRLDPLKEAGANLPQAALRFILGARQISSTIPAMNSIAEVEENVGAVQSSGMSRAEIELLDIYAEAAEQSGGKYLPEEYRWLEQWKA